MLWLDIAWDFFKTFSDYTNFICELKTDECFLFMKVFTLQVGDI